MDNFCQWWQHLPQMIDPVIFKIGGFGLRYYGLMYVVAFTIVYFLVIYRVKNETSFKISAQQVGDLTISIIIGLIIGARLGYVVIYNLPYYINHPLEIILPFQYSHQGIQFTGLSGMSYHGGLIGVIIGGWLYTKKHKISFAEALDLYTPTIPIGYAFGRIGNFINGELFGRQTSSCIGMYFPGAPGNVPRHPSQLYEAFFEGFFLFCVLWPLRKIKTRPGSMLSFYLIGYGAVRFFIEYFREPDAHIGLVFLHLSMGQLLCGLMMLSGLIIYFYIKRRYTVTSRRKSDGT